MRKRILGRKIKWSQSQSNGLTITHIMYADDIVLFSKANRTEANVLNSCLEKYCN